ncbi:T9SS type A sorting domain-containing protein [Aestuariibaculum suncheonense]|uniref:T9SS type A sorting domain-containing protein n=1 Tax=Aestuariibaculum suncheonense TaxID=1028745 RepID=A0A8J6UAA2_9FLAO|nr:T9SS type A sorting domain-containing protein [Aestuariibaculum suncheonense]MBD0834107.1 T9SS type A sorting domain-containing protein [Aestuariibaculum suncheonense]
MKKNYVLILLFSLALFTSQSNWGQNKAIGNPIQQTIENLSIYPNPVSSGKTYIYITTKQNLTKKIEFFDVLGKRIYTTMLTGKELNISNLNKGVYILKVTENNISETRKLVIR